MKKLMAIFALSAMTLSAQASTWAWDGDATLDAQATSWAWDEGKSYEEMAAAGEFDWAWN